MPDYRNQNRERQTKFVPPPQEQGYILITAVWMLLLGASIVAYIMAHNLRSAEEYSFEREQLKINYAQESAVETVVADMLFNGPRGTFARLPAEANYTINNINLQVSVSSESGKIDVNRADPALIDRALRGFDIPASQRQVFLDQVITNRAADRLFASPPHVSEAMEKAGIDIRAGFCPSDFFTVFSGLGQPVASQMLPELARALGQISLPAPARNSPGTALRIQTKTEGLSPVVAVVRTSGLIGQPVSVIHWSDHAECADT